MFSMFQSKRKKQQIFCAAGKVLIECWMQMFESRRILLVFNGEQVFLSCPAIEVISKMDRRRDDGYIMSDGNKVRLSLRIIDGVRHLEKE